MGEGKASKRSFLQDLVVTFSSPMAWLLVMALVLTWTGVAIVLFDLLDYKTLAGTRNTLKDYTSYCDDPKCFSPGLPPPSALGKKIMRSKVGVKALKAALAAAPVEEESADWLETAWAFLASLVAPEDEAEEGIHQLTEFTSILSEEL